MHLNAVLDLIPRLPVVCNPLSKIANKSKFSSSQFVLEQNFDECQLKTNPDSNFDRMVFFIRKKVKLPPLFGQER
jgi:hypothetical protein